jgi:hypothetical protein
MQDAENDRDVVRSCPINDDVMRRLDDLYACPDSPAAVSEMINTAARPEVLARNRVGSLPVPRDVTERGGE